MYFDVKVRRVLTYTVSCYPRMSTLIADTADFKWERYMINQSLYVRVSNYRIVC